MKRFITVVICLFSFSLCFVSLYSVSTILTVNEYSSAVISAFTICYYIGYLFMQIPGGYLADKLGAKKLLIICLLCGGISSPLLFVIDYPLFQFLLRLICGIGSAPVMAACVKILSNIYDSQEDLTKAIGILLAGPPVGILISNSLIPALLSSIGTVFCELVIGFVFFFIAMCTMIFIQESLPLEISSINLKSALVAFFF